MIEQVSGVGAGAKRIDKNLSQRTQKIQREAKLQNAAGGTYSERSETGEITKGIKTAQTASAVSADITPKYNVQNAFAPGNPSTPLTDGSGGNTPGRGEDALDMTMDAPDAGSLLVRAMYLAYPTPEIRRLVEAYNEEGLTGLV